VKYLFACLLAQANAIAPFMSVIDIQSDDEARAIFHTYGWSNFWIKCSERFPEFCGKVKLLLLTFTTTYFAEHIFCQVVHTRNKYRNRFDMNKPDETQYDLN